MKDEVDVDWIKKIGEETTEKRRKELLLWMLRKYRTFSNEGIF
ncbi:MAG: hypothetical protein OEY83_04820 [Candidatus Bathyarchaeota archaeon]|nr:hypothetical protein [Candidatus Bathyarchaeota archaeon]